MNIEIKEDFVAPFLNVDPKWIDELIASKTDIQNKVICIEELSELTKEITKEIRGEDNKYEIVDEMVDVIISLQIMARLYHINQNTLDKAYNKKMRRNLERIRVNKWTSSIIDKIKGGANGN
nr:MAG TPA: NTP-PPase-like protein [Caudoviricetes sp.]DAS28722.1 MAG TPA: NTP-PPase-like protein [Caudoviricetes sp.]